jgi:hypothetical protein
VNCFRQLSVRIRSASLDAKKSSTGFCSFTASLSRDHEVLSVYRLRSMASAPSLDSRASQKPQPQWHGRIKTYANFVAWGLRVGVVPNEQ